ncbi:hypothetical protein AZI09_12140 (plasmid) [Levilactobacillus brevis]|nr:hypothetical protein [Levilactobacillus brevis]ARN91236.1 hypothetical protein AZI09_12140 [Levilactobacillus brevis]
MGLYVQGGKKVGGMYMADGRGNATKVGGMYYADGKGNATKIFQNYVPAGTVLWSGHAIFCSNDSDPIMRSGMVMKSALELPKYFKDLKGIKLTFGLGTIVKTYDIGDVYLFTSGETGSSTSADGTSVTYPSSVTVTRKQLMSGNTTVFKHTDINFYPWDNDRSGGVHKYDLKMYTNKTNSLVLAQQEQSLTNFVGMVVANNYSNNGNNYYYAYPVLTKIEAI